MSGLNELNSNGVKPTAGRACPLGDFMRVIKVRLGDEPVALLVNKKTNVLLGLSANSWTAAVDKLLDRLLTKNEDLKFRRCQVIESLVKAGFVYLSFDAANSISRDAKCLKELQGLLEGALHKLNEGGIA